ncbi:MAG: phosphoenolpyruvate--protein phosphotransferase [Candidatus Eremiobacterota bacterium]
MDKSEIISPGIGSGRIFIVKKSGKTSQRDFSSVEEEKNRLAQAVLTCKEELEQLRDKTSQKLSEKEALIFEAHLCFLHDPMLIDGTVEIIEKEKIKAEEALQNKLKELEIIFAQIQGQLFQNRWADLKDVAERILRILTGRKNTGQEDEKIILISPEITPSEILEHVEILAGIITEKGSMNSHSSILARALKIPGMIKTDATTALKEGEDIILDCNEGLIISYKDEEKFRDYKNKITGVSEILLTEPSPVDTFTEDGERIILFTNILHYKEVQDVINSQAEGVGIYRTEFAYLNRMPSEKDLYEDYKKILEKLSPLPVTFRTLDIGADKWPSYLPPLKEVNPSLGLRGIRYSLHNEEIFTTQIKAIVKASVYGNPRIILPMISCLEDVIKAKKIIKKICGELNIKMPPLGIMLETPSSILCAETMISEIDFMSIGTNDLVQYTMAADRESPDVKDWYQSIHPAMLKLYSMAADTAEKHGLYVSVCGEIGGDTEIIPVLIGCGIRQFSMVPGNIRHIREKIQSLNYKSLKEMARKACNCNSSEEVRNIFSINENRDA